jgi:alkanesulfonate monooxygenase SsuD/methylene tetrahydromethanopterin reductase-like flavin-dependent oxidoreductase (luciferase family)
VILSDDDDRARRKLGDRNPAAYLVGGPESVATQLQRFVQVGATHLIVAFPEAGPESYGLFADAVLPHLRDP